MQSLHLLKKKFLFYSAYLKKFPLIYIYIIYKISLCVCTNKIFLKQRLIVQKIVYSKHLQLKYKPFS